MSRNTTFVIVGILHGEKSQGFFGEYATLINLVHFKAYLECILAYKFAVFFYGTNNTMFRQGGWISRKLMLQSKFFEKLMQYNRAIMLSNNVQKCVISNFLSSIRSEIDLSVFISAVACPRIRKGGGAKI